MRPLTQTRTQPQFTTLLDIIAIATTNFVRSLATLIVGSLFLFYTTIIALGIRVEYAQGDYGAVATGVLLFCVALGATIYFCYAFAPSTSD